MMLQQVIITQMGWFCPLLIWLVLLCFFCAIFFALQDGILHLTKLHQIPCDRCAFYTGEHCLKCTIHPYKAFTEEAINCQDWEVRASNSPYLSSRRYN
ncbi:MAG: hypothetical protein AAGF26_11145 [Cyanobacteria bacterium P01_G01_bin.49]